MNAKPITLFLDMDGVLANFESKYEEMFDVQLNKVSEDIWENNWRHWVEAKAFEKLDWFKGARELIDFATNLRATGKIDRLEILSASGGQPYHDEVVRQKNAWLKSRGLFRHFDSVNVVESGKKKGEFAHDRSILIDDTYFVVHNFRDHGGIGLLHDGRVDDMFYQSNMALEMIRNR